jgi:glutamyl-tRNA(Gln) amidotransferase subunit E
VNEKRLNILEIDFEKLGLKVGLEIHQQLNIAAKLFCSCKPALFKEEPEITFLRRLRPTQSELGQVDPAAYFEFQKGVRILYEANHETSCLVEMDEEPPHALNVEAVETVLTAALLMNAMPVSEVHVMRKTVIDGSNTTGFQRTCAIALNGEIKVNEKAIPIQHASLEEDAARKTGEKEGNITKYRIDRLGIPLIEVATGPVIKSPKEAEEVALAIGRILRATGKVIRGLGSIRQDINISIPDGALIEIKGLQELELVSLVVEYEVQRQLNLIKIRDELKKRNTQEGDNVEKFFDITNIFKNTECKVIRKALEKRQPITAMKLSGFRGLLKRELAPQLRLGTEMADRARFWGRVGGLFHTDELPAYGITEQEVETLRRQVGAEAEDAVVFVADSRENAEDALRAVVERAHEAFKGVPQETRAPNPDGTTRYMRPRPGAARMYPETDIPPLEITKHMIDRLKATLPELPEQKLERFQKEYKINEKLTKQVLNSEYSELFETIVRESHVSPTTVAAFLTETLKSLKRESILIEKITDEQLIGVFKSVGQEEMTKEALPEVARWLSMNEGRAIQEALKALGLQSISIDEIEKTIEKIVRENDDLIKKRGQESFGPLMGIVMGKLRGRADAATVSRVLKEKMKVVMK